MKNIDGKFLIIDFETDSLDLETLNPIEFSGVLCDENSNIISCTSFLIKSDKEISPETEKLTGISFENINNNGTALEKTVSYVQNLVRKAKYVVAHHGLEFDFKIMDKFYGFKEIRQQNNIELIDTLQHFPSQLYPNIKTRKLSYLAFELGVIIQDDHRVVNDTLGVHRLINKVGMQNFIDKSRERSFIYTAQVSFDDKQKAKDLGFQWDGSAKLWKKKVFESEYESLEKQMTFNFTKLEL